MKLDYAQNSTHKFKRISLVNYLLSRIIRRLMISAIYFKKCDLVFTFPNTLRKSLMKHYAASCAPGASPGKEYLKASKAANSCFIQ